MIEPMIDARWAKRKQRAGELKDRWPFAAEVLAFYSALLDVQEQAFIGALEDRPSRERLAAYAVERVLPRVIEVSVANGPPAMTDSVLGSYNEIDFEGTVESWLRSDDLTPVERYLARATTAPIFEALGTELATPSDGVRDERHCPTCGALPQLSYFATSAEDLVTAHRYLECSRCATTWPYPRMKCASCGESEAKALKIFGETRTGKPEINVGRPRPDPTITFPHLRVDGCETCSRYLLTVNLELDGKAVPVVDELAALPLTLYANERGMTKLVPNLMGF